MSPDNNNKGFRFRLPQLTIRGLFNSVQSIIVYGILLVAIIVGVKFWNTVGCTLNNIKTLTFSTSCNPGGDGTMTGLDGHVLEASFRKTGFLEIGNSQVKNDFKGVFDGKSFDKGVVVGSYDVEYIYKVDLEAESMHIAIGDEEITIDNATIQIGTPAVNTASFHPNIINNSSHCWWNINGSMKDAAHRALSAHAIAYDHEVLFNTNDKITGLSQSTVVKQQCETKLTELVRQLSKTDTVKRISVSCELPLYEPDRRTTMSISNDLKC